ncbi:MAG: hypothetical protein NC124_18550 [Clostridium sp.]|nr:hypothetical protein [Clostridium sp.]
MDKIQGLELTEEELANVVNEPVIKASSDFSISWLGSSGSTNSASVQTTYSGGTLGISVVVTGTPTWGTACVITVTPTNCELKSGKSNVTISIDGGNLGNTFLSYITPKSSYKGKTVKYTVSIRGAGDAVLYAKGNIGAV